jgi:hypothetical protein
LLAGKYTPDGPKPVGPRGNIYSQKIREIQPLIETMRAVGQSRGKSPAQVGYKILYELYACSVEALTVTVTTCSRQSMDSGWGITAWYYVGVCMSCPQHCWRCRAAAAAVRLYNTCVL